MTHIRITIDELILDGTADLDQAQLVHALQQALSVQAADHGLPRSVAIPQVRQDVDGLSVENVARQIARTIYGGQR